MVLLALLAYFAFRPSPPAAVKPAFIPCDLVNTNYIKVETRQPGGRTVTTTLDREKAGLPWQLVEPKQGEADAAAVQQLISAINGIHVTSTLNQALDPARVGLSNPSRILTCRVEKGQSYTLFVGDKTFDGSGFYAELGDGKIKVIAFAEVDEMDKALAQPLLKTPPPQTPAPAGPSPAPSPSPSR